VSEAPFPSRLTIAPVIAHMARQRSSRPHMLRPTFVTTMLDAGVHLRDVQMGLPSFWLTPMVGGFQAAGAVL
jgi:site-specific recombinase XerD